jgi:hypothetical protein
VISKQFCDNYNPFIINVLTEASGGLRKQFAVFWKKLKIQYFAL